MSIMVGFSRPKKHSFPIFSWLIRLIEWTPYSHCYIRWGSEWLERDVVYEASGTMVHFKEGKRFDDKVEVVHLFEIECSSDTRKKVIQKAMDFSGAPYGLKQVAGILLVKMARWIGCDLKNPFSDGNKTWVCSEIVAEILEELGVEFSVSKDNVTPRDLFEGLNSKLSAKITRIK